MLVWPKGDARVSWDMGRLLEKCTFSFSKKEDLLIRVRVMSAADRVTLELLTFWTRKFCVAGAIL